MGETALLKETALSNLLLCDADAVAMVPVVAHVAADHEGSVLDAPARAVLEAVARLVVYVVEDHHR